MGLADSSPKRREGGGCRRLTRGSQRGAAAVPTARGSTGGGPALRLSQPKWRQRTPKVTPEPEMGSEVVGHVGLQPASELLGLAEGQEVSAGHLVEGDAEAVPDDSALELHREQAVV